MRTVTADTNIVRDYLDPQRPRHRDATGLMVLHTMGSIEIALTTRIDVDVPQGPLKQEIEALDVLSQNRIGSVWRLGSSALGPGSGAGDMIASDDQSQEADALLELLFPGADPNSPKHKNRLADVDHLMAHKINQRDVFVTNEKAILERKAQLLGNHDITVMTAAELLSQLRA